MSKKKDNKKETANNNIRNFETFNDIKKWNVEKHFSNLDLKKL